MHDGPSGPYLHPMRPCSLLVCLLLMTGPSSAQAPRISEAAAKEAVYRIVQHSGLSPTFTVKEEPGIPTANAYIKGHERIIAYNPAFISTILDSTRTDWSAVSVLAHEIAHHLLGHTLDPDALHPGDELACDRYSGFILQRMGATLEQSLAAMEVAGNVHGTRSHPPKHARLAAIRQGWQEAGLLATPGGRIPFTVARDFTHVVHFAGDANTYYVNPANELVWFDQYAEPIPFGRLETAADKRFAFNLTWQDRSYRVDAGGTIWTSGTNGIERQVGRMEAFEGVAR